MLCVCGVIFLNNTCDFELCLFVYDVVFMCLYILVVKECLGFGFMCVHVEYTHWCLYVYVWFASMKWFAKAYSVVECSVFVCSMCLCLKQRPACPIEFVKFLFQTNCFIEL